MRAAAKGVVGQRLLVAKRQFELWRRGCRGLDAFRPNCGCWRPRRGRSSWNCRRCRGGRPENAPGRGGRAVGPECPHLAHRLGLGPVAPRASGTVRQGGSTVIQTSFAGADPLLVRIPAIAGLVPRLPWQQRPIHRAPFDCSPVATADLPRRPCCFLPNRPPARNPCPPLPPWFHGCPSNPAPLPTPPVPTTHSQKPAKVCCRIWPWRCTTIRTGGRFRSGGVGPPSALRTVVNSPGRTNSTRENPE
jgi:hypothetical protein